MILPDRPGLFAIAGVERVFYFDGRAWTMLFVTRDDIMNNGLDELNESCARVWERRVEKDQQFAAMPRSAFDSDEYAAWERRNTQALQQRDQFALRWSNAEFARQNGRPPQAQLYGSVAAPPTTSRSSARPWIIAAVVIGLLIAIFGGGRAAGVGATARCEDGSFSYSQHHSGTCSWHGGVASWINP